MAAAAAARKAELAEADALARARDADRVALEEASALRLQAAARAGEAETAATRARAEAEGRVMEARETEDLRARAAAAEAAAARDRLLAAVSAVAGAVQEAVAAAFSTHLHATAVAVLAVVAAFNGGRAAVSLAARAAAALFRTPQLVRESSRLSWPAAAALRAANVLTCGWAYAARRRAMLRAGAAAAAADGAGSAASALQQKRKRVGIMSCWRAEGSRCVRSASCGVLCAATVAEAEAAETHWYRSAAVVGAGAATEVSTVSGSGSVSSSGSSSSSKAAGVSKAPNPRADSAITGATSGIRLQLHRTGAAAQAPVPSLPYSDGGSDIVLEPDTAARVARLAAYTRAAQARRAPLRHALLFGPPGTGKTLVAQALARRCGLDYAIMSGGDVAALGPAAVPQLQALFAWAAGAAAGASGGLVLFVDEAEAFLGRRQQYGGRASDASGGSASGGSASQGGPSFVAGGPSDQQTTALNALATLLAHTGSLAASGRVALLLATNRPSDLDAAVLDRMDEMIPFPLPGILARCRLARLYFDAFIGLQSQLAAAAAAAGVQPSALLAGEGGGASPAAAAAAVTDAGAVTLRSSGWCCSRTASPLLRVSPCVTSALLDEVASLAEGFSGRQMAKLMLKVQAEALALADASASSASDGTPTVTGELLLRCLQEELTSSRRLFMQGHESLHSDGTGKGAGAAGGVTADPSATPASASGSGTATQAHVSSKGSLPPLPALPPSPAVTAMSPAGAASRLASM